MCLGFAPVQFQSQRPVDGGEAQQAHPPQQDAAENARLEKQNSHLQEKKYRRSGQEFRPQFVDFHVHNSSVNML